MSKIKYGFPVTELFNCSTEELRNALCTTDGCGEKLKAAIVEELEQRSSSRYLLDYLESVLEEVGHLSVMTWISETKGLREEVDEVYKALKDEKAKVKEARDFAEELCARQGVVTCVYCGHEYPEGTPRSQAEVLTEHVKVCPKHPARKLADDNAALKNELEFQQGLVAVVSQEIREDVADELEGKLEDWKDDHPDIVAGMRVAANYLRGISGS